MTTRPAWRKLWLAAASCLAATILPLVPAPVDRASALANPTPVRSGGRSYPSASCALSVLTTIPTGVHPKTIAAAPALHRAYVSLADSSSVVAIDTTTNRALATWPTDGAGRSNGIAFADGRVYVSKRNTAKLAVLDASTGALAGSLAVGRLPYGVGAGGHRAWVANFEDGTVSVVDTLANRVIATTAVGPSAALVATANDRAYVSYYGGGLAVVGPDGTLVSKITTLGSGTFGVAANAATNRVYTSNRDSRKLSILDGSSNVVLKSIQETSTPYGLAINPASNRLFVVMGDLSRVHVRDGNTLDLVADVAVGGQGGDGGDGIAIVDNRVYVANNAANSVSVIADDCGAVSSTPVNTSTATRTNTLTPTRTRTATASPSSTPSRTRTRTATLQNSPTSTASPTGTASPTRTATTQNTPTRTVTPTRTATPTPTATSMPIATLTPTASPTSIATASPTPSLTRSVTPSPSPSATPSSAPTATPTAGRAGGQCTVKVAGSFAAGGRPKGIAADPATGRVYVSLYDSSVAVFDSNSTQKLATWQLGTTSKANGVAQASGRIFVALRDTNKVSILDSATGAVVANRDTGRMPYGVAAAEGRAWIAGFASGSAAVVDAASTNSVATTAVGANPSMVATAADRAFVAYWDGGVAVVDRAGKLLANWKLASGSFGVAYDPVDDRVYVSNRVNRQIVMLDGRTGAIVKQVTSPSTPFALAFNRATGHLFAVLAGSNLVEVRDGRTLEVITFLGVGAQGNDGGDAIAVFGDRVFVGNNAANTVSVLSDSCAAGEIPTATPAPIQTVTPTASAPIQTATVTPSATALPGITPTRTGTPTPTQTATATATATPTVHVVGRITVHEESIQLLAYDTEPYSSDAVDSRYNVSYRRLDLGGFLAGPRTPAARYFKTIVFENDYLRLTFLPELGGRLYQVLYKTTGQTLFYNNKVLKPSPWGPVQQSGWLAAGGMEWALPVEEHGYEWGIPWQYSVAVASGSATISFADSGSNDRVRAVVSVTLPENAAYFIVHPRVINPTTQPLSLQFWVNAQVALNRARVSPETEFVLPTLQVLIHSTGNNFMPAGSVPPNGATRPSAPIAWPAVAQRDLSYYGNWDNYLGVFISGASTGFMGAYDHGNNLGIARVYAPDQVTGGKLFAFGPNFNQRSAYTDDGSDYFELWGGLPRTFFADDNVRLGAGETREWQEYWVPFANTGGLSAATQAAVLSLTAQSGRAAVGAIATSRVTQGILALYRDNIEVKHWDLALEPGTAFRDQAVVPDGGHLRLRLTTPDGTVLADTN